MVEKSAPELQLQKLDSDDDEIRKAVKMEEERKVAMSLFQTDQSQHLKRQHELDEEHNKERSDVLKLERTVDEKVADAIRHAEEAI